MNCKPGDLCICIADFFGYVAYGDFSGESAWFHSAGKVCRVVRCIDTEEGMAWEFDAPMEATTSGFDWESTGEVKGLPDSILRPLPELASDEHEQVENANPLQVTA